ncbi:MAG: hypothetical protein JRH20_01120 [Deltaproteobacteria bacterium]|nr:hypothetical protein [Deltaproteobacteria bacterium]
MKTSLVTSIAQADQEHRSWRKKLEWVRDLLAHDTFDASDENLIYLAIYLRFLGTGELPCAEDGGHYRPSHHAHLSAEISSTLADIANEANAPLLRRIYPWLPSFDATFTRREPLTRIRDIAHRNDIPQPLKHEIKTTLQNKLHRCAAPSDLATSGALLKRITAKEGEYSADFISEFQRFHDELEEFFGAHTLTRSLEEYVTSHPLDGATLSIRELLKTQTLPSDDLALLCQQLALAAAVRRAITPDPRDASEQARRRRLVDIKLEEHAFMLLGRLRASLETTGDANQVKVALRALGLTLDHLAHSGELGAEPLRADLASWREDFHLDQRDQVLRLKAFIERCRQLVAEHSEQALGMLVERARRLGEALGIAQHAISTFVEGELRGTLIFQLAALSDWLGRTARSVAGLSPWVALVPGKTMGRLVAAKSMEEIAALRSKEDLVVRLQHAAGDETIPGNVKGVILSHEIPQLAHLGVRARQAGVPFTCCDEAEVLSKLDAKLNTWVELQVEADRVQVLTLSTKEERSAAAKAAAPPPASSAPIADEPGCIDVPVVVRLDEIQATRRADPLRVGGKAARAARLAAFANRAASGFRAPMGVAIPFATLERQLDAIPARRTLYDALVNRLGQRPRELSQLCDELRQLVYELEIPQEIVNAVRSALGASSPLMVRSSSSTEDLRHLASAGLYDSVINVGLQGLRDSIRTVWASLWSPRAVRGREAGALPHAVARMGVLIQPLVTPELSFIMHTVNPISGCRQEATVELVVGHGETLASARFSGSPFRLICNKISGETTTERLASIGRALIPDGRGGLREELVDYASLPLMTSESERRELGRKLARIAARLEEAFGHAQDVEGVISKGTIHLVQSRAQQGLDRLLPSLSSELRLDQLTQEHTESALEPGGSGAETQPASGRHPKPSNEAERRPRRALSRKDVTLFGMFEQQISGDSGLLLLAQRRMHRANLGAEFHAAYPEQLEGLWHHSPNAEAILHLPRDLDLLEPSNQHLILDFARRFAGRLLGIVVHDQWEMVREVEAYGEAVSRLDEGLAKVERGPHLFVEYAVGLAPEEYLAFFGMSRGLAKVGACIDTGHVGIWQTRVEFARRHREDACALAPYDPRLPGLLPDLRDAMDTALPRVLEMIEELGGWGVQVHYHLHDGHPLWHHSPYGVADHLSFLHSMTLPFGTDGTSTHTATHSGPLYGPKGLEAIVEAAVAHADAKKLTMTLEIHALPGQEPLDSEDGEIFAHWRDLTNAQRMNYWMSILVRNQGLLNRALERCCL